MKNHNYVIIVILIIAVICFSWLFFKHNSPHSIPRRAKLVWNEHINYDLLFYKDVENMENTNYYKKRKNYIIYFKICLSIYHFLFRKEHCVVFEIQKNSDNIR